MEAPELDDGFTAYLLQTGMATAKQIERAKQTAAEMRRAGRHCSLAEVLVEQGIITAAQRKTVERKILSRKRLGQYELIRKLGEGGMGSVFLAEDTVAQRKVAIKILLPKLAENPDFLKRFQREARAIGKLNHPNIVNAYAVGEEDGQHYYVMEFCEGEGLDSLLKRRTRLAHIEALEIAKQIAEGLKHAHAHNLVHRDIKPGNILIAKDGSAKILDLGLSKSSDAKDNSFCTVDGVALGTPHYIAPEQARGQAVDGRTDIYSLGATLFHLLAGRTPFDGPNAAAIMMKHVSEPTPRVSQIVGDVPANVDAIVFKMMQRNPAARYSDCAALLQDLDSAIRGENFELAAPTAHLEPRLARSHRDEHTEARTSPKKPRARSNDQATRTAFIFGCATVALISGYFLLKPGKSSEPLPQTSVEPALTKAPEEPKRIVEEQKPKVPPLPDAPPVTKTAAVPPTPIVPIEPKAEVIPAGHQENAINLLPLVDPKKDAIAGNWHTENGELICDKGRFSRLELPYRPPDEYDFVIEFTRTSGNDVNQVLAHAGKNFIWNMGGWENTVFGFDLVDDTPANESPKSVKAAQCLVDGRRYKSVVQIRRNSVTALLDDKPIVNLKTDYSNLGIYKMWALRDKSLIGLATHSSVTFHRVEVIEVSGKGQFTRKNEK